MNALFRQPENLPPQASKREIRRELRLARKRQPENVRRAAERRINRELKRFIKRGKRIAVYWAIGSELRLDDFARAAQQRGAQVYLPYIAPRSLKLWFTPHPVMRLGSLKTKKTVRPERTRRRSQIQVPQFRGNKIRAKSLHIMVLPIVGIDARGYRLGQGGGYYDCTLAACPRSLRPQTVAAGFACQSLPQLPAQSHDIRVCHFASERGVWRFKAA